MVRKALRSNYIGIHLKGLSKRPKYRPGLFSRHGSFGRVLDSSISIRSLLKYSGITLAFIIIFVSVFMLGRVSVSHDSPADTQKATQLSGQTKQVPKSGPVDDAVAEKVVKEADEPEEAENESSDIANLSSQKNADEELPVEEVPEEKDEPDPLPPLCENTVAGFDYAYRKVIVDISNFQRDIRGDNWASLTSLKLTITNNETCTIINPTKVKLKLNPKFKGTLWWDDDIFLPESFQRMLPGQTVSEVIPVHVSYSDIHNEKEFKLTVFDDYDVAMGTFKKDIILP